MWLLGHRVARLWESRGKAGDRPGDCAAWPEGATLSGARRTELGGNRVAESQDALNLEPRSVLRGHSCWGAGQAGVQDAVSGRL